MSGQNGLSETIRDNVSAAIAASALFNSCANRDNSDETPMPSDLDIFRSAAVLIEHHGADAKLEAAQRADAMLAKGDAEGHGVWLRIARAIETLQHAKALNDEANH